MSSVLIDNSAMDNSAELEVTYERHRKSKKKRKKEKKTMKNRDVTANGQEGMTSERGETKSEKEYFKKSMVSVMEDLCLHPESDEEHCGAVGDQQGSDEMCSAEFEMTCESRKKSKKTRKKEKKAKKKRDSAELVSCTLNESKSAEDCRTSNSIGTKIKQELDISAVSVTEDSCVRPESHEEYGDATGDQQGSDEALGLLKAKGKRKAGPEEYVEVVTKKRKKKKEGNVSDIVMTVDDRDEGGNDVANDVTDISSGSPCRNGSLIENPHKEKKKKRAKKKRQMERLKRDIVTAPKGTESTSELGGRVIGQIVQVSSPAEDERISNSASDILHAGRAHECVVMPFETDAISNPRLRRLKSPDQSGADSGPDGEGSMSATGSSDTGQRRGQNTGDHKKKKSQGKVAVQPPDQSRADGGPDGEGSMSATRPSDTGQRRGQNTGDRKKKKSQELMDEKERLALLIHSQGQRNGLKLYNKLLHQGVNVGQGVWTPSENQQLVDNWTNYFKEFPCEDPSDFLQLNKLEKSRQRRVKDAIRNTNFWVRIGKGIPRHLHSIRDHLTGIFLRANLDTPMQFTPSDDKRLLALHKLYNNNWSRIAECLGKDRKMTYHRYKRLLKAANEESSSWTKKEDDMLREAVRKYSDGEYYPWKAIARHVEGHTFAECSARWGALSMDAKKRK